MNNDWTNPLPSDVPPQAVPSLLGERENKPRSMRFPADIARAIDELAAEHGQESSTTTFYLLKLALAEVKARRGKKKPALKRAS